MDHKPRPNQPLLQEASSLLLVTALCGAGGALTATTSNAAIVAMPGVSPASPVVIPANVDGLYFNVVTGAQGTTGASTSGWDINPYSANVLNFFTPGTALGHGMTDLPGDSPGPGNLSTGFIVDASNTWVSNLQAIFGATPGDWTFNASNNFGFRFTNENTGQTHFGWGRVIVGADANTRSLAEVYYEDTPLTPIAVGATHAPEPTGSLLAVGAAGLLILRRRRQSA